MRDYGTGKVRAGSQVGRGIVRAFDLLIVVGMSRELQEIRQKNILK